MDTQHDYGTLVYSTMAYQDYPRSISYEPLPVDPQAWPHHNHPATSPVDHVRPFSVMNSPLNHVDYAASSTSYYNPHNHNHHNPLLDHHQHIDPAHALNLTGPQIDSSIGPSRVMTRRRAAQLNAAASAHPTHTQSAVEPIASRPNDGRPQHVYYQHQSFSRPHTPNGVVPSGQYRQHQDVPMSAGHGISIDHASLSPQYPHTSVDGYSYGAPLPSHSRSASGSGSAHSQARSASPALSVTSAVTSHSSNSGRRRASLEETLPRDGRNRKHRLYNTERRDICEYARDHPGAKQEEIAARFRVERSTISKILKHKNKWLNVNDDETFLVAKQRPSKFPEVEAELKRWIVERTQRGESLSDNMIRDKARSVAKQMQIPDDKFKASSGWIENFKNRHGIKKGLWQGEEEGTLHKSAIAQGHGADLEFDTTITPTFGDWMAREGMDLKAGLEPQGRGRYPFKYNHREYLRAQGIDPDDVWAYANIVPLPADHPLNELHPDYIERQKMVEQRKEACAAAVDAISAAIGKRESEQGNGLPNVQPMQSDPLPSPDVLSTPPPPAGPEASSSSPHGPCNLYTDSSNTLPGSNNTPEVNTASSPSGAGSSTSRIPSASEAVKGIGLVMAFLEAHGSVATPDQYQALVAVRQAIDQLASFGESDVHE